MIVTVTSQKQLVGDSRQQFINFKTVRLYLHCHSKFPRKKIIPKLVASLKVSYIIHPENFSNTYNGEHWMYKRRFEVMHLLQFEKVCALFIPKYEMTVTSSFFHSGIQPLMYSSPTMPRSSREGSNTQLGYK